MQPLNASASKEVGGGPGSAVVLVIRTVTAAKLPRSRRRGRETVAGEDADEQQAPSTTKVTVVLSGQPFETEAEAEDWLQLVAANAEASAGIVREGIAVLNRALHAAAAARADSHPFEVNVGRAMVVRLGHGTGDQLAEGMLEDSRDYESPRIRRGDQRRIEMQHRERVAAVLGGRAKIYVCETMLIRGRADLDAGRRREATLQVRDGVESMLIELSGPGAPDVSGHSADMEALEESREAVESAAQSAVAGDLDPADLKIVTEALDLAERVLRRRRILQT